MNLFQETGSFLRWLVSVARVFLRLRPLATLTLIGASIGSRITALAAFLLPLKLVHVATSDSVPQWFEMVFPGAGKDALIAALFGASIGAFVVSLLLDALKDRLTASGSVSVLSQSNRLAVFGKQDSHAQAAYTQFSEVLAGALFVLAGYAVVGLLAPWVIVTLVGLLVVEYVITGVVLRRVDSVNPRGLGRFIRNDLNDYLNALSTVNFLVAIAVLIYPLLVSPNGNVQVAVGSIIILRRVAGILTGTVKSSVTLAQRRPVVNALIFRDLQFEPRETPHTRTLREAFGKQARQRRTAEALRAAGVEPTALEVHWEDSAVQGVNTLMVTVGDAEGSRTHYQQQIYPPQQDYRVKNEDVLFRRISRRSLNAPALLIRFQEGTFDCQLCEAGAGVPVTQKAWARTQYALIEQMIGLEPPRGLVRDFCVSHPVLHDRLSDTFLARLEIAIDTAAEQRTFDAALQAAPTARAALAQMPLWLYNPELKRGNVLQGSDGAPLVMAWGKWALEPVGAALPEAMKWGQLEELARHVRENRADAPATLGPEHLQLAAECWALEQCINSGRYKAGLRCMRRLLANVLLESGDGGAELEPPSGAEVAQPGLEAQR